MKCISAVHDIEFQEVNTFSFVVLVWSVSATEEVGNVPVSPFEKLSSRLVCWSTEVVLGVLCNFDVKNVVF